ncbi:MAG TPA: FecR domain-containing protein, partial [Verrucomicrobiae bacterium]
MKKSVALLSSLGCILASPSHATDLKQSKLTQVVNDVQIISAANQNQKAAALNDIFAMPDILRTGNASRAELTASDATITRVGANTIFSFDPANRTIDLKQGSLLFHAPHGKGGGTIHTGSATASVLGTTLIITTTPNGGFKVLALEGEVEVRFLNGLKQKLDPGQMTFILPGANQLAPVIIFRLDELTANSLLINGFTDT